MHCINARNESIFEMNKVYFAIYFTKISFLKRQDARRVMEILIMESL